MAMITQPPAWWEGVRCRDHLMRRLEWIKLTRWVILTLSLDLLSVLILLDQERQVESGRLAAGEALGDHLGV